MGAPRFRRLPRPAQGVIAAAIAAAVLATAAATALGDATAADPSLFAAIAGACAVAARFEVRLPGGYGLHPGFAFLAWGAVALPPALLVPLAVLCCAPSVRRSRPRWYVPAFNVSVHTLAALAAGAIVAAAGAGAPLDGSAVLALLPAAAAFVAVNHAALGLITILVGQRPAAGGPREHLPGLWLDLALALTGALLAVLWAQHPSLTLLAAGPLMAAHRALLVPALVRLARTDPKTGLFHLAHFEQQLDAALATARRRDAPLAVLMVDLDHLRAVNNRFGHLAGDRAIREVAERLRAVAGGQGVPARFGGEEFCLLLPGAGVEDGRVAAERLRAEVEAAGWMEAGEALAISVSVGVAAFPQHGADGAALLRAADAALYEAKLSGRNRVRAALAEPLQRSLQLVLPLEPARREQVAVPAASGRGVALDRLLDAPAADAPTEDASDPQRRPGAARFVPWLAALLLAAVGIVAVTADPAALLAQPGFVAVLVVAVLALDAIRIDVFDRATISPASVPTLVLAAVTGPLGPLCAEAAIAVVRLVRRQPAVRSAFDLGALGLAGAAAAVTFAAVPGDDLTRILVAGPLAGLVHYAVNAALLATVMGMAEGLGPVRVWRERLAWLWPHYLAYGALAACAIALESRLGPATVAVFAVPLVALWLSQKQYVDRLRTSVGELRRRHDELERANRDLQALLDEKRGLMQRMQRSYLSTITSLARTIEAKDPYTSGHTERVAQLALMLAEDLGLTPDQLRAVEVGAIIHDIGKIGVPDRILLKPGRLDEAEFAEMRRHPKISTYIVGELELPAIVKQMVRSHHERYDGGGYPDGLAGEEIPLAARILAVADTLDAMTSDRPYRTALALDEAVGEIREMAGRQFCPRVVEALLGRLRRDRERGREDVLLPAAVA